MRNALLIAAVASMLCATGCLTLSLYPLYTDKDAMTEFPLEGKWTDADQKETWEIRAAGGAYVVSGPDKSEPVEMRVVKLGDQLFIDIAPTQTPSLAIAGHLFGKIRVSGDELRIQTMNDRWLEKTARASGLAAADTPDHDTLLTASTAEVRKLVLDHASDPDAFNEAQTLRRVPARSPSPAP